MLNRSLRVFLLLLFLLASLATSSVKSQANYQRLTDVTKKKDTKLLHAARQHIGMQRYAAAVASLDELIVRHPNNIDLLYMRGTIQKDLKNYSAAIDDLNRGLGLSASYNYGVYLELGELYRLNGELDKSIRAYEDFLKKTGPADPAYARGEQALAAVKVARDLMANPLPFVPQPVSGYINSDQHLEYFPNLSIDGGRMIFVRRLGGNEEDFFESYRQEDGSWSKAEPLEYVNSEFNEGAQTVSADGHLIVYTICGKPRSLGGCDLYFTEFKNGRWSKVANMGPNINGRWKDTQPTLSADGRLLLFASSRPGGIGGDFDIYGSARDEEGNWSKAVNMGPTINTKGADLYPFLHADGRTLYFTSDGHPGMGGQDLFFVRLLDDNTWTTPKNLGYPINTFGEETNIFISMDGEEMFFSKHGTGEDRDIDIYTAMVPDAVRPIPTTYVRAKVIDAITRQPIEAKVRLRAVDAKIFPKTYLTEEEGDLLLVLAAGQNYAFSVDKEGYFPYSRQFSLDSGDTPDKPFEVLIELHPALTDQLPTNQPMVLRNVLFNTGSADLLPVSFPELDRLYELLNQLPSIKVEIGGHTDNVGSDSDNQALSEARAKAVQQYLLEKGIPSSRIEYQGYGETKPVADNNTSAGRAENRRTEFRVL